MQEPSEERQMTKQEEIREHAVETLCRKNGWDYSPRNEETDMAYEDVDCILETLHNDGVVVRVMKDEQVVKDHLTVIEHNMVIEPLVIKED